MRDRGLTMPLLLGLPGPVERARLLIDGDEDRRGGVHPVPGQAQGTLARLAAPGGFTGERFLEQCAPGLAAPDAGVEGLHVFTFNQIAATEAWREDLLRRLQG